MNLTEKANKIFKIKYSINEKEAWADACLRISNYVASIEEEETKWTAEFFKLIYDQYFLPGGRIIANAGTNIKNLMNCFVLPLEDSRKGIYKTLENAAEIFAWGGGIGYNFSDLREKNSPVITTGGKASGPLSFMSLFDQTGEVISQASRRGAQMGMLNIDHPDILNFIKFKSDLNSRNRRIIEEFSRNIKHRDYCGIVTMGNYNCLIDTLTKTLADDQLTHFNISVVLNDEFMNSVLNNKGWKLKSRVGNPDINIESAKEILKLIAEKAWDSGDPGLAFYDRVNEDNIVPYLGDLKASNPCGEIFLLPYEPCCLGSINLKRFYDSETNSVNWDSLGRVIKTAVRFLDNVQSLSYTPVEEVNEWSKGLRRLGLGVMGFADLLAKLEIPYNSEEAIHLAEKISWFLSYFSLLESINLGSEKGVFPFYDKNKVNLNSIDKILNHPEYSPRDIDIEEVKDIGFRNVSTTAIAPTGTIALISDVNSGIEPFFGLSYRRNITEGVGNTAKDFIIELNSILFEKLKERGLDKKELEKVKNLITDGCNLREINTVPDDLSNIFKTSSEIHWKDHINIQSAFQKYITNSVSKTINMSNDSTVEEIYNSFIYGWEKNLKGMTVYRDGSKFFQILDKNS